MEQEMFRERNMNLKSRHYFLSILIPVTVIVGSWALLHDKDEKLFLSSGNPVIELREDGFYPKKITIREGETITFKTTRDTYFWPASNLHPTHTLYPEFDPAEPISPNKKWGFQFDQVGIWEYHDHIDPDARGIIYVINKDSLRLTSNGGEGDEKGEIKCNKIWTENAEKQLRCWDDLFRLLSERAGINASFKRFEELYAANPFFRKHCHRQAHIVGEGAYWQFDEEKKIALTDTTKLCGYGFYHGFMQEFVSHGQDNEKAGRFCENLDKKLESTGQCYHGIGHGLVYLHASEIWDDIQTIINLSLEGCKRLTHTNYLTDCFYGVYGGIESFYWGLHSYALDVEEKDPFSLCEGQSTPEFTKYCYNAFLPVVYGFTGLENTLKAIQKIPEDDAAFIVIDHLGYMMNKYETEIDQANFDEFITLCQSLKPRLNKSCVEGFVKGFIQPKQPQTVSGNALNFCASIMLSKEEKKACIEGTFNALAYFYSKNDAEKVCKTIKDEYKALCFSKLE